MTRYIRLGDLTESEKERTILALSGFNSDLRKLLEELGAKNGYVKRRYDELLEERSPSLPFLERAYVRTVEDPRAVERRAEKNDRVWQSAEVHL